MIKIIAGVYGYKENGIILPKDKDSEPFSLDPEREAELVTQGVAEYANVIIPEAELEPEPETAGAEQQPAEDPAEPEAEEPCFPVLLFLKGGYITRYPSRFLDSSSEDCRMMPIVIES